VQRRHFAELAKRCGLGPEADRIVADVVERLPHVLDEVHAALPRGFPQELLDAVFEGMRRHAKVLG
jgi:serine/threonine-protein kinase HipA